MDQDEFYSRFQEFNDRMDEMEANGKAFHEKLQSDLFNLVFDYWPEEELQRSKLEAPLRRVVAKYSQEVMECLNGAQYYWRSGEEVPASSPVPEPMSAKDADKQIEKLHRQLPNVSIAEWRDVVWEDFGSRMKTNHFVHKIHQCMKQALTDFYLEYLLLLEGPHFLYLDSHIYWMGAYWCADEMFGLMEGKEEQED